MGRIIFVTGTGTGVGKTAVTALLLEHCIRKRKNVRAIKPFCTGDRGDALLLWELQERKIPLESINPFYFEKPVSPWTAARLEGSKIDLKEALKYIQKHSKECQLLLVEGAGGIYSPLGDKFTAATLIDRLGAEVIVVALNRLGVLNEVLLTMGALPPDDNENLRLVLVEGNISDASCATNWEDLHTWLGKFEKVNLPFLKEYKAEPAFIREHSPKLDRILERLI